MYEYINCVYIALDIDECLTDNGGCTQKCNNTVGSYDCSCWNGYELSSDKHTCTGKTMYCISVYVPKYTSAYYA